MPAHRGPGNRQARTLVVRHAATGMQARQGFRSSPWSGRGHSHRLDCGRRRPGQRLMLPQAWRNDEAGPGAFPSPPTVDRCRDHADRRQTKSNQRSSPDVSLPELRKTLGRRRRRRTTSSSAPVDAPASSRSSPTRRPLPLLMTRSRGLIACPASWRSPWRSSTPRGIASCDCIGSAMPSRSSRDSAR